MPRARVAAFATLSFIVVAATAQEHDPAMHGPLHDTSADAGAPAVDAGVPGRKRQVVHFPRALREHTLANMRDHLLALQQIQEALSTENYDGAAEIAEQRLGMSSMRLHGAHEVAKYMPTAMQSIGSAMHRSASQFAAAAQVTSATCDVKPTLAAYSRIVAACVACHAGYRAR
ncbi:MAG: hypothetical protein PHY45_05945 [Rhodocyclaceae bacterium]|nr:hypothetical protein [Rhodocyclaceae bacterium]